MSTLASLKAVLAVSALAMGAAAVAFIVAVQRNPYKFTNLDGKLAAPAAAETAAEALPMTIELQPRAQIAMPVAKSARAAVVMPPKTVIRSARAPSGAGPVSDATEDKVVAAPCVEGEYRKIEENRGVRMICPGSDAMAPAEPEEP